MNQGRQDPPISAVVITMNEEAHIERCLESLGFCDEILIVDSHSTDGTRDLAEALGAKVIERDWPGFGPQKAFGVQAAAHDWILAIDADERISPVLRKDILACRAQGFAGFQGYRLTRISKYLGRWIRHGSWYPDRVLRLFDRRAGTYNQSMVHEKVELQGEVGQLQGHLLHLPYRDMQQHLSKVVSYTDQMAHKANKKGDRAAWYQLLLNPAWRFFKFYILQGAWKDGRHGFLLACITAQYNGLKYAQLYAMQNFDPAGPDEPANFEQDFEEYTERVSGEAEGPG